MNAFLKETNQAMHDAGGCLEAATAAQYRSRYRELLKAAEDECPAPEPHQGAGKRGRVARSKALRWTPESRQKPPEFKLHMELL